MLSTPILRLPVELHLEITSLLDLGDHVRLASTARYFRSIIPAPTHNDFLAAEECAWARSKQLYACKSCVNFHTWEKFADNMRKGKWCRNGTHANERFCLKCGVNSALYARGTLLTICNRPHVLCSRCGNLTDQLGHQGMCAACSPDTRRSRGNRYFDHEDEWTYATNRISDRNHVRDFYNWPED